MDKYEETLDYLYSRLPMYQRVGKSAYKKDLNNTVALLEGLGNPHWKFKTVHIAGTNGKGSSAHAIAAILQSAGYKTGLYTSPHLKNFTERIRINGKDILTKSVTAFVEENRTLIENINPSFFEVTVAMAFDYFSKKEVDIAVIETGLGGRLDSTNVITPEVSLITTIGLEHTDLLGDTLEKIAFEKAGIIKPNVPVVVGDIEEGPMQVINEVAQKNQAKFVTTRRRKWSFDLSGKPPYFEFNIPGIIGVIDELKTRGWKIDEGDISKGINRYQELTGLKGRFQTLSQKPLVIADVSHNPDGLRALIQGIKTLEFKKLHLVFGTVKDKPLEPIFDNLPADASFYFTESTAPRSLDADELAEYAKKRGIVGKAFQNVEGAKKAALESATSDDLILITGSTFVVAELIEL